MCVACHHLVSDFIQEDPQKSHEVGQEGWAHFIQEEINMLSRQEVAEPGLEPLSYRSDNGNGNGVWGS